MNNWKEYKLGDLVTFQRGHDLARAKMIPGVYPVAGSNSIIGYHNEYTTRGPGITIGRSGNIGNPKLYKTNFWAHNTVLYVKEFKAVDPLFFYYLLKTLDFSLLNSGSAVPSLNRNYIHPFKVTIPESISTQTAIAEILSSIDDKIELNNKIIQELENLAQTLFKQWFVDFGFPDENGEPYQSSGGEMVDSELGEIPKGWEVKKLGDLTQISSSKRIFRKEYVNEGIPFFRGKEITELDKSNRISTELFISKQRFDEIKTKHGVPKSGDILITSVGTIGNTYLVSGDFDFYFKDGNITWIKGYKSYLNSNHIFTWLRSNETQLEIIKKSIGSTQQALTITALNDLNILLPNEIIAKKFNVLVEDLYNGITNNKNENQELTTLRDTLLPKLISGEIEVNSQNSDSYD